MHHLRGSFQIIRGNLRAYLVMNAFVFGLFFIGMGAALVFPGLSAAYATSMQETGTTDLVGSLLNDPWLFALTILAVNVLTVAVPVILLPSMIVPFAGIPFFAYQMLKIGVGLAPINETIAKALIPHSLTILIEFQAYVLVLLGAYLLGKSWLRPQTIGANTRRQGYLHGLRQVGGLGLPALALFVIGAVYEAFEIRYLVPLLIA